MRREREGEQKRGREREVASSVSELTGGICEGSSEQMSALVVAPVTWRQSVLAAVWQQDGAWEEEPR